MATYALTIAGVSRDIRPGWTITKQANAIGTMTFEIVSVGGSYRPAIGDEVILTEDAGSGAVRIFGGTIDAPAEARIDGASQWEDIAVSCSAVDFNEFIDRRVLDLTIPAGNLDDALGDLVAYLADYGVTLDGAQAEGPALPELVFSFTSLRSAFDQLAELTDWVYRIDDSKVLKMIPPSTTACPFDVVDGDGHAIGDVIAELRREEFGNIVYVLGGSGQQTVEDAFTGDGSEDTFELTYTLAGHVGYVTVNGTNETLDETGSGATWEWSTTGGVTTITRTSAPTNGHAISITYTGQFPKLVFATASPAAADRVERIYSYPDVFDATVLQELADNRLARQNVERQTVQFSTRETGILPGQTLTITIADRDLDDTYLVRSVTTTTLTANSHVIRHVKCERGTAYVDDSWQTTVGSWGSGGVSSGGAVAVTTVTAGGVGGSGTSGDVAVWTASNTLGDGPAASTLVSTSAANTFTASQTFGDGTLYSPIVLHGLDNSVALRFDNAAGTNRWGWFLATTSNNLSLFNFSTSTNSGTIGLADHALTWAGTIRSSSSAGWAIGSIAGQPRITHATGTYTLLNSGNDYANLTSAHMGAGGNYLYDLGTSTVKYRTLYAAEVQFDTLVAQEILATVGGSVIVANTTTLTADLAAAGTTITVKHNSLANGDRILLKARGQVEWMAVTSVAGGSAGAYTYSVTRNLDGTGANDWIAGDAVVSTGTTGDGYIDLYATSGVLAGTGPTIVGNVRTGTTWNQISPRWAIGNLNGVGYGSIATDLYGAAFGTPSAAHIIIDPTNGIRIRHNTTDKITLDASGNAAFSGSITAAAGTVGGWTIGASSLTGGNATLAASGNLTLGTSNDVVRLSADDGTYRIWVGHATAGSAPFRVGKDGSFTATNATVTGDIVADTLDANSGTIGGLTIDGTLTIGASGSVVAGGVTLNNGGISFGSSTLAASGGHAAFSGDVTVGGDTDLDLATITTAVVVSGMTLAYLAGGGTQPLFVDNSGAVIV